MNALVAYASKHGSTVEIAEAVAETLRAAGIDAVCVDADAVDSVEGYDAVVLGSAVYMRRWRPDARRFLRRHRRALAQRPFWVFSSGPVGPPEADAPEWMEPRGTMRRVEALGARSHVVFGGRAPTDGHGPAARAMERNTPAEYRDRRDWDAIRAWANEIAADIASASRAA